MDWHRWGEEWDETARRRWKDEPIRYDYGDGTVLSFRALYAIGPTVREKTQPAVLFAVEAPSIIVSISSITVAGVFKAPMAGHRVTRVDTGELFEVVHREKERCFRAHGTSLKELRIFLEQIKA